MCNCRKEGVALVHTDPGFNEFIWLVLIVVCFGAIMALLFFLCEILSRTQNNNLEKLRTQQKPMPKKAGFLGLKQPIPVPVPIPSVSKMVDQEEVTQKQNFMGSLFALPPPPPVKTISPPPPMDQILIPAHTRTIPAYPLSVGLMSHSRIQTRNVMTPSTSAPPKPSAQASARSDAELVQTIVGSAQMKTPPKPIRTLSYTPPQIDAPLVDHGVVKERRITIPSKNYMQKYTLPSSFKAVGRAAMVHVPRTQTEEVKQKSASSLTAVQDTEKTAPKVKALTRQFQTAASLVMNGSASTGVDVQKNQQNLQTVEAKTGSATQEVANGSLKSSSIGVSVTTASTRSNTSSTEVQEFVRRESKLLSSEESNSTTLAHGIMMRLLRGQQESELLFRQIQSLEKKMEFMFLELGKKSQVVATEKVTQGVQTNEVLPAESAFAQALTAYEATERDNLKETLKVESRAPKRIIMAAGASSLQRTNHPRTESPFMMSDYSASMRQSSEWKPTVRTTTQVISLEAVPVISRNTPRSTPVPPLVHSRQMSDTEKIGYTDSGEDSEEMSIKSESPDLNVPVFQVQRNVSSMREKNLNVQNSNQNNNLRLQKMSSRSQNGGRMSEELSEEALLRLKYEQQLNETISQLRADCQQRLDENQDEQRFLYSQRESGLQKEVGSLSASIESQGSFLASLQWKLSNFEKNITTLADEKILLENCTREVKSGWEADKRMFNEDKQRLEGLLLKMRAERQELLKSYQHLVGVKVALDSELVKYKTLIEDEEKRSDGRPLSPLGEANHGLMSAVRMTSEGTFTDMRPLSPPTDTHRGLMSAVQMSSEGTSTHTRPWPPSSNTRSTSTVQVTSAREFIDRRPLSPPPQDSNNGLMAPGQITSERTFTFYST